MYSWVTHTHTHLGGQCPHECRYCYVQNSRFGKIPRYTGPVRMVNKELNADYGRGKVIFIEHMNDLFAEGVPAAMISDIIEHCKRFPANQYVFQTKNPDRARHWLSDLPASMNILMGTTIESNRHHEAMGKAPAPELRYKAMMQFFPAAFVTIEPIMDFDVDILAKWIIDIKPAFVNIGADSKGKGLPEPTPAKVRALIEALYAGGVTIRKKTNLARLGL